MVCLLEICPRKLFKDGTKFLEVQNVWNASHSHILESRGFFKIRMSIVCKDLMSTLPVCFYVSFTITKLFLKLLTDDCEASE